MKTLNLINSGAMILLVLCTASQMIIHALSGITQGTIITAIGAALAYFGYKKATKE